MDELSTGHDEAMGVSENLRGKPGRVRRCTDHHEQTVGVHLTFVAVGIVENAERRELCLPTAIDDAGVKKDLDVVCGGDGVYEVFRHAFLECVTAHNHRHVL